MPLRIFVAIVRFGTVIALPRSKGHRAMGLNIDPLAILISSVWTTSADKGKFARKHVKCLFVPGRCFPRFDRVRPTRRARTERPADS